MIEKLGVCKECKSYDIMDVVHKLEEIIDHLNAQKSCSEQAIKERSL